MDNWVKLIDENYRIYYYNTVTQETKWNHPLKTSLKKNPTLSDFMKRSRVLEKSTPRINKIPTYLYNSAIDKHLTLKAKTYMDIATSKDPRSITEEELRHADESDIDKAEDAAREQYDYDDDYDRYYNPDLSPNWEDKRSEYAPSQYILGVADEISEKFRYVLQQQFPELPDEIINNALEDGKNSLLLSFESETKRLRDQDQEERKFYEAALESINKQKKIVQAVMTTILLSRERSYDKTHFTSNSKFGSSLVSLPSRPLENINEKINNLFNPEY